MKRPVILGAFLLSLSICAAPAQEVPELQDEMPESVAPGEDGASQEGEAASEDSVGEQAESEFDPTPFLESMVNLRRTAVTCDPFVANQPAERTAQIEGFFQVLEQALPNMVDTATRDSLSQFVGNQAAQLCRDMLNEAFDAYRVQAIDYQESKPEAWPAAPSVSKAQWCTQEYCLDM